MARLSSANPPVVIDPTAVNLSRLLVRLQQNLNSPDPDVESKLRSSSLERERVGQNLEYARKLLLKLEQEALNIKVQSKKVDTQTDLVKKRDTLNRLSERLEELNEFADPDAESSDGEDLLGEDTPSETTDGQASPIDAPETTPTDELPEPPAAAHTYPREAEAEPTPPQEESITTTTSTLRSRQNPRAELFSQSTTTGISTSTETLLTHNRTEQEAITASLLSMASALKESSRAFNNSLEAEASTLNRTVEGLDRNELGLEAASRKMGHLRALSEGKGWWGRMQLYAYIAGLWMLLILLVFAGPKLRF